MGGYPELLATMKLIQHRQQDAYTGSRLEPDGFIALLQQAMARRAAANRTTLKKEEDGFFAQTLHHMQDAAAKFRASQPESGFFARLHVGGEGTLIHAIFTPYSRHINLALTQFHPHFNPFQPHFEAPLK